MLTLGIDTSNYTTSCALYDSDSNTLIQRKKLLPVKPGEKGIRQSDAVFHHTQQLYPLIDDIMKSTGNYNPDALGVSDKPRDADGSYMPCFTVGLNTASSVASVINKPLHKFSHQDGHIMAALYSSGRLDLIKKEFLAFHVSGGTTEVLHITPGTDRIFSVDIIGKTNDINCGQAIDRAGVMMGMNFPCGKELESFAVRSEKSFNPKVCVNEGNCNLSGIENQCRKMISDNFSKEDISKFCLDFVGKTIEKMAEYAYLNFGQLPFVFAGGVMSDNLIRNRLTLKFDSYFAEPEFSCDNAAGIALLAYFKEV